MEYNIYLDVFFLLNFIMNLSVLYMTHWILRERARIKRMGLAAMFGSLSGGMLLFLPITIPGISLGTAMVMSRIAFGRQKLKDGMINTCCLYFMAFSMEGAIRRSKTGWGVILVMTIVFFIGRERRARQNILGVILTFKGKTKKLRGFYDTGNQLLETATGRMVHIASYEAVKNILPDCYREVTEEYFQTGFLESTKVSKLQMYEFTFLSYHSIGKETGQLLGIRMDSAVFFNSAGKKTEEKAVIALTNQNLFEKNHCQIIINGRLEL